MRPIESLNNLTFENAYHGTSKTSIRNPARGKEYEHFLSFINHLNQRKSPSAPLVSQEIETDFFSSSFFQKSREVPEGSRGDDVSQRKREGRRGDV